MQRRISTDIRQEQIAEAALHVIATHGLSGLSMQRIAQHLDLATSALYRHFAGKEEVLDAAINRIGKRLLNMVATVRDLEVSGLESLRELLKLHIQMALEFNAIPRLLFSDQVWIGNPARKARLYAILTAYLEEIAALLKKAQEEGAVREELDLQYLSVMYLSLFQPAIMMLFPSDGGFDILQHLHHAWNTFLEGITSPLK